jgi:hypothetical protein
MDDKMKMLSDFVNNLSIPNMNRHYNTSLQTKDMTDNKNSSVLDKLVFPK